MEFVKIEAQARISRGKGAARRLRSSGLVPGVIYGKDVASAPIFLDPKVLTKALSGPLRTNTPLDIVVKDDKAGKDTDFLVILRDHQYDPVTRALLHVDFLAIDENVPVEIVIPVSTVGRSVGEQMGGVLRLIHRTVPVTCKPREFPAVIEIDVSRMETGEALHTREVAVPDGVTINLPDTEAIVAVSAVTADDADDAAVAE